MNKRLPGTASLSTLTADASTDHLWDLIRSANQGDRTSLVTLESELQGPHGDLIVMVCGDLARQVERSALDAAFSDDAGTQSIIRETLNRMRSELGWEESGRIEQLLIERVVLTWLHLHIAEMGQTQSRGQEQSLQWRRYAEERLDRLNKRHLAAIKSLATVRKLMDSTNWSPGLR